VVAAGNGQRQDTATDISPHAERLDPRQPDREPREECGVFGVWGAPWGLERPGHVPIVLGLNLTENVAMTPTILSRLAIAAESSSVPMSVLDDRGTRSVASNPLIRVLEDAMRFYFEFHFDQGEGYLAHLHDPLAAAAALEFGTTAQRERWLPGLGRGERLAAFLHEPIATVADGRGRRLAGRAAAVDGNALDGSVRADVDTAGSQASLKLLHVRAEAARRNRPGTVGAGRPHRAHHDPPARRPWSFRSWRHR